jgi:SRSO17 transposase
LKRVTVINQRINCRLPDLKPVEINLVQGEAESALWKQLVSTHHYLGYRRAWGRRLRYLVWAGDETIGALGWKSGALKLQSRDCFIGWSVEQRKQYLAHILNNDRFVIAEGVRVRNLASHVLARNMRMVSRDWESRYGVKPYLLETFIDPERFSGSSYRAAGWQHIGSTKGYEKLKGGYRYHGRVKEVYVYVVEPEFRRIIGCERRSCPQEGSLTTHREERLRMMIQEAGYNPDLINWAGIQEEVVGRMAEELVEFHQLFGDCFRRKEQRLLGQSYLGGLLSDVPRKNVEAIALAFLGPKAVRCQQNFLSRYLWDEQRMLERHQGLLAEAVGEEDGMHTVDSSEIPKKGKESVGVARQYCGSLGKRENCQSGVFVGYTSRKGYGLVDRRLYVPKIWFEEQYAERRKKCGIPSEVQFQTKIEIGLELLEKQMQRGLLPGRWIGCDSFFGSDGAFRDTVAGWGKWYLAEIRSNIQVLPLLEEQQGSSEKALALSEIARSEWTPWQRVVLAEGAKGPIVAEVSIQRVREIREEQPSQELWLIIRRLEGGKLKYYLSNAPQDMEAGEFQRVLTMRWPIEQCLEDGKKYLGMDHYENRSWNGWHRHMLYVFLAMLFLLRLRLKFKKKLRL